MVMIAWEMVYGGYCQTEIVKNINNYISNNRNHQDDNNNNHYKSNNYW